MSFNNSIREKWGNLSPVDFIKVYVSAKDVERKAYDYGHEIDLPMFVFGEGEKPLVLDATKVYKQLEDYFGGKIND